MPVSVHIPVASRSGKEAHQITAVWLVANLQVQTQQGLDALGAVSKFLKGFVKSHWKNC